MVKLLLGKGVKLDDATFFCPFEVFKYLLKRGANPKATNWNGDTLLHKECEGGNLKTVKYLIQHYNADVNAKNNKGQTPLHLTCRTNYLKIVKFLIEEQKADPAVTCNDGKSALHYAAEMFYSLSILRYLIEVQKLDTEATDNEGRAALHIACQSDLFFQLKWETQKYLIEEHPKIIFEAKDKKGKIAQFYCLEHFMGIEKYEFDNFRPIALILATKAYILKTKENKDTDHIFDWIQKSYHYLMKKNRGEDVDVLCLIVGLTMFRKQLCFKSQTKIENNPLLFIVGYLNRVDIAKFMFNQDVCIIEKHLKGEEAKSKRILLLKSYFEFSCENGLMDLTRFLFQEINNRQESFQHLHFDGSFLKSACINKHIDIFKYLLEDEKAKEEAAEFLNDFPLHYACKRGSLEMLQYLIETKKIDIEVKDKEGRTPLLLACIEGLIKITKYLIAEQNANINTTDNKGRSVLHSACQSRCFKLVKYISQKTKPDVNDQDEDGSTALHLACKGCNHKIVKFLITDMKANHHLVDKEGRTPLHVACQSNWSVPIPKLLVIKGANVLAKDNSGKSPLQFAVDNGKITIPFVKAATKR